MNKKKRKKILMIISIVVILFLAGLTIYFLMKNSKPNVDDGRTYCSSGSRNAQVCIDIYEPVCGYPVARTYSNSCVACSDANVGYYYSGGCPGY